MLNYKVLRGDVTRVRKTGATIVLPGLGSSFENLQGLEACPVPDQLVIAVEAPFTKAPDGSSGQRWWDIPEWGSAAQHIADQSCQAINLLTLTLLHLKKTILSEACFIDTIAFSQGAAAAAAFMRAHPCFFRRAALVAGFERNVALNFNEDDAALSASESEVLVLHGEEDEVIPCYCGSELSAVLQRARMAVTYSQVGGGHWIIPHVQPHIRNFLFG